MAPTEAQSSLAVITDPEAPPTATVGEIADQIPARAARLACAGMMVTLGAQSDWTSETIEWVASHLVDIAPDSVPTFTDWADGATEFWRSVDETTTDSADGQDMAWLRLNEALADHQRLAGQDQCGVGDV